MHKRKQRLERTRLGIEAQDGAAQGPHCCGGKGSQAVRICGSSGTGTPRGTQGLEWASKLKSPTRLLYNSGAASCHSLPTHPPTLQTHPTGRPKPLIYPPTTHPPEEVSSSAFLSQLAAAISALRPSHVSRATVPHTALCAPATALQGRAGRGWAAQVGNGEGSSARCAP